MKYLWILCLIASSLYADSSLSLAQTLPPPSKIIDFEMGSDSRDFLKTAASKGLILQTQKQQHTTTTFWFNGIPKELSISQGKTRAIFLEHKLVRIDFFFEPTFHNFLIIKNLLLQSDQKRFSITKQEETIDSLLKARLSAMSKEDIQNEADALVKNSMEEGKTFFFYAFNDAKGELNVTFSFSLALNSAGKKTPNLQLHYSSKEQMAALSSYHKALIRGATSTGNDTSNTVQLLPP